MDSSCISRSPRRALAVMLLSSAATAASAQQLAAPPGIDLSAESFSYDGGTSKVDFRALKISQNDLGISADTATVDALDFKRSAWHLHGNVRISVGTAKIASDEALLTVKDEKLATVELRGTPATFEESVPGRDEKIEGHANRVFFDSAKRTLTLTENVWLRVPDPRPRPDGTRGANEITSCDLIFDLEAETFSSGTTDCGAQGVHIKPAGGQASPPEGAGRPQ
jgi:lipopolysaccharide transport protein LptA